MTDSRAGYRRPSSQMEDVPIDDQDDGNTTRSRSQYVPSNEKSARCLANQWGFYGRYKITILTGIVSIIALLLFTVSIIYMAYESAADDLTPLPIKEESVTVLKPMQDEAAEEIDLRENIIRRQVYEILPKTIIRMPPIEVRRIRKREAQSITSKTITNIPRGNIILKRVGTGSAAPSDVDIISNKREFIEEIFDNNIDDEHKSDKRETEKKEKLSTCQKRAEHCKEVFDHMQSLVQRAGEDVGTLNELLKKIRLQTETERKDPENFQDFLQCVECGNIPTKKDEISNDSIAFVDDSEATPAIYERHSHRGINSGVKNLNAIMSLMDNNPQNHKTISNYSSSTSGEEYRSNVKNTNSESIQGKRDNTLAKSETQKTAPNVQKTVQVSRSKKVEDGAEITNIIRNTTIIKTQSEGGVENEIEEAETSTKKIPDSVKPIHKGPIVQEVDFPSSPTGPSATSYRAGDPSLSGWSENTKTQVITEDSQASNKNAKVEDKFSQGWSNDQDLVGIGEPRILSGPQFQQPSSDGNSMTLPTAETMKTSQQVQYTPSMPWMPYSVCYFGTPPPATPTAPLKQSMPGMMTFPASSPGAANYPFPGNQYPLRRPGFPGQPMSQGFVPMQYPHQQQQGPQFVPNQQFQQYQQGIRVGPSGPGNQNFVSNFGNLPTGPGTFPRTPYYCTTYMPNPTFQFPTIPGVSEFQRSADTSKQGINDAMKEWAATNPDGSMYPGYAGDCNLNSHRCSDGSRCIPKTLWCDGNVDCPDASDETKCSCRDRISKERICDGYFDCPHGEDELGCFGCPRNTFPCDDRTKRYQKENCVPLSQRCDGVEQCPNGKDEKDCHILTGTYIEGHDIFSVGYADGFLHKNWRGQWYPACSPTESWAAEACIAQSCEPTSEPPLIQLEYTPPGTYGGKYIFQTNTGAIHIVPTCYDKAVYVNCAQMPCGTRDLSDDDHQSHYDPYEDSIVATSQNQNNETTRNILKKVANEIEKLPESVGKIFEWSSQSKDEKESEKDVVRTDSRIVGGRASSPKAWPFLIAIFMDGYLHCGGAIVNPEWILTAAHCVDGFPSHYYEITAGLLRRYSFSPTVQNRRAEAIKIHPAFDLTTMKNDLALIKLNEPLRFNRWVRATCLPKSSTNAPYWKNNPGPDTSCVTVGWGATVEHGYNPDQMREVEIPILPKCKYAEDQNDAEICAGLPQGGRDSCQGDSGGPLLCKYPGTENTWYVAAVVSHGIGCARPNEPGAYTKVSKFVDWIDNVIQSPEIVGPRPIRTCPGFTCGGGLGKCIPMSKRCDKVVHCMDAEDEMNCQFYKDYHWQNHNESSFRGSEWVGQSTPDFPSDLNKNNENESAKEGNMTTSKDSAKHSVFTMDSEETTITTDRVETFPTSTPATQKNMTDATSVNGTEQPMTTTSKPQTTTRQSKESNDVIHFACTRITQSVPISERCNRFIDCEDGTDEDNCSCKDYLANSYPLAICDGHVDCYDGSDEKDCTICRKNEFVCSRSGKCISKSKMCDHHIDCPYMEDELDCFTLTNGDYVILDLDKRPHLNLEGVVTQWKNGVWRPACQKHNTTVQERLSNEFCVYFGFRSAESVQEIIVRDSPIEIRRSTKNNVIPYEYPPSYEVPDEDAKTCQGLYVRCKPVLSADMSHLVATNYKTKNLSYLWPWQGSIFVDGRYHCPAILLEDTWLLATSRCVEDLELSGNYTMAVLGIAPTHIYVDGPYQQIVSVNAIKVLPKLDAALLHLQYPVNMTRYVQPIFVQKKFFPATKNDICVATGVDEKYRTKTTLLQPEPENCTACHRCYTNATVEDCRNKTMTNWSGTIVCRGAGTWYPAAIFHEKDLRCGFQTVQTLTSIDYGNAHFTEIMDEDLITTKGPICDGMRCPLGKCIPWTKVCDGIDDCRDGSDEDFDYCRQRKEHCENTNGIGCKCSKSELRCANGQCVPKEAFCDYKRDCADGSDEPARCTCANYLKLTAPERLCDNIRHCYDKSDESSELCFCKDASFKCSRSVNGTESCVSQDFVCDGDRDCANGEDEKTCRRVLGSLEDPRGTGEVLRCSFGVWHSECFPSPIVSPTEISDLCKSMGYTHGTKLEIGNEINSYGPALVPQLDQFYMIRLNNKTWLNIRDPKPLISLGPAKKTCHRAFVKCT